VPATFAAPRPRDWVALFRLDRPVGIWLLLWPTLWGVWAAAEGLPSWPILLVFVLGTVLMRSAGCAINDAADRDFDLHVSRTRDRPVAAGRISRRQAVVAAAILALLSLALLLSLGSLSAVLWSVPAVVLAGVYPLMKRYIAVPQAVLGLAFSGGIPMAYAATRGSVPWAEVSWLMAANFCAVMAYDTAYAMADKPDDLKIGVKSSAIYFGRWDVLAVLAFNVLMVGCLLAFARQAGLSPLFYLALVAVMLGVLNLQRRLMQRTDAAFAVFKASHWLGAAVWLGLVVAYGVAQ
jgi:4-hydroxybenzoate polyprenyltransferase